VPLTCGRVEQKSFTRKVECNVKGCNIEVPVTRITTREWRGQAEDYKTLAGVTSKKYVGTWTKPKTLYTSILGTWDNLADIPDPLPLGNARTVTQDINWPGRTYEWSCDNKGNCTYNNIDVVVKVTQTARITGPGLSGGIYIQFSSKYGTWNKYEDIPNPIIVPMSESSRYIETVQSWPIVQQTSCATVWDAAGTEYSVAQLMQYPFYKNLKPSLAENPEAHGFVCATYNTVGKGNVTMSIKKGQKWTGTTPFSGSWVDVGTQYNTTYNTNNWEWKVPVNSMCDRGALFTGGECTYFTKTPPNPLVLAKDGSLQQTTPVQPQPPVDYGGGN